MCRVAWGDSSERAARHSPDERLCHFWRQDALAVCWRRGDGGRATSGACFSSVGGEEGGGVARAGGGGTEPRRRRERSREESGGRGEHEQQHWNGESESYLDREAMRGVSGEQAYWTEGARTGVGVHVRPSRHHKGIIIIFF
jgi:hypothetical protein